MAQTDSNKHSKTQDISLKADDIIKSYGKKRVLNGISIELNKGEVVGLLGPNGSGKTTIFHILMGVIRPQKGSVMLKGKDVTRMPMHRRSRLGLSYLPQDISVFRDLSVENNIMAALEFRKDLNKKQRYQELDKVLEDFSLTSIRKAKAAVLSGGEKRRTEIARLLVLKPDFALLDEPFAGVDPISVEDIKSLIKDIAKQEIGILINDHNVRDTISLVDRSYVIGEGKIIGSGKAEEILSNDYVRNIYLGKEFRL